ncbi:MAG: penicillin-binding protein 2 [Litorimonas sp.]
MTRRVTLGSRQKISVDLSGKSFASTRNVVVADDEFIAVSEGRIRIRIGAFAFVFMVVIALVRLAEVSLMSGQTHQRVLPQALTTERADITDRNGELLATTLETYSLYAEPRRIWNPKQSAKKIVSLRSKLDMSDIHNKLESDRAFVWLERGLTPKERQAIFELGLPGIGFRTESKRVYPRGDLASHFVGFTNLDLNGIAGAERALNERLTIEKAPDVALSLDMRVQFALADELARSQERYNALSASGVVMNIKTGEIVAMASLPNFDPNVPHATLPQTRFNHAAMSTYDLGSVFKPLTMAMALEDNIATKSEMFDVHKPYKVRYKYIRDDHPSKVPLNMMGILSESSNRGTAMLAQRIGADSQKSHLRNLGLLDRVPYELAESARPQVQDNWGELATVTISYGHGLSVTPLALTAAIGATLNDGVYITPTILRRDASSNVQTRRVFRSDVSDDVRHMMREVVTVGTGKKANVAGYGVMGKTGTAEKPSLGGYDQKRLVTSFIAAFPYSDPTYSMIVTLDEPKAAEGTYGYATAGWNAAPTAGHVIARIGPMLSNARHIETVAANLPAGQGVQR